LLRAIQNQVQEDLLQLNTIPLNGKRPLRKVGIYRDSILGNFASRPYNHLIDRLIEIKEQPAKVSNGS
jgi:hypothetical protein